MIALAHSPPYPQDLDGRFPTHLLPHTPRMPPLLLTHVLGQTPVDRLQVVIAFPVVPAGERPRRRHADFDWSVGLVHVVWSVLDAGLLTGACAEVSRARRATWGRVPERRKAWSSSS